MTSKMTLQFPRLEMESTVRSSFQVLRRLPQVRSTGGQRGGDLTTVKLSSLVLQNLIAL